MTGRTFEKVLEGSRALGKQVTQRLSEHQSAHGEYVGLWHGPDVGRLSSI